MHFTNHIKNPDKKYGTVLFYWWCGEKLTKEKLSHQISIIKDYEIAGLQINYCHSYEGGNSWGLTYPGTPAVFSDEWWELFDWFTGECKKYGIKVSLSDYTLSGVGQGYYTDEILRDHPVYKGKRLSICHDDNGSFKVEVETVDASINPLKRGVGDLVCEYFFDRFEKNTRFKAGEDFDFFFSDELNFGIDGYLWDEDFETEFKTIKGYDIKDHYSELFLYDNDFIKTRTDYYDVMIELMNRNYFSVIYDYHESRGMTYGCDHGIRGLDPIEFGSYFSTQKYNQGPGCDQPGLRSDIIKNKVAASIANVHGRPRVWLEGFYGSGWGTDTDMLTDAICRNFTMGHNLLALHGTYYTTLGGFWEWAPPCNLIRMPYKDTMKELLMAVKRMSYIMSRGYRYTKVAVHYPTASLQCGINDGAVKEIFDTAESLYKNGIDFDFIDDEAILGGMIEKSGLKIGDNTYECIVFPKTDVMREGVREVIDDLNGTDAHIFKGEDKDIILKTIFDGYRDVTVSERKGDLYISHRVTGDDHIYMIYGADAGTRIDFNESGYLYGVDLIKGTLHPINNISVSGGASVICPETSLPVFLMISTKEKLPCTDHCPLEYCSNRTETVATIDRFDISYESTLNNKYGDFSLPAYDAPLPLEVRTFDYSESDDPTYSDDKSKTVTYGFGPYYKYAIAKSDGELQKLLSDAMSESPALFEDYVFSLRYGVLGDPGIQGYHGLKGEVTDDFLTLGKRVDSPLGYDYKDDGRTATVFLFEIDYSGENAKASLGNILPSLIFVNGKETSPDRITDELLRGKNRVVTVYDKIGRTHLYLYDVDAPETEYPLAASMFKRQLIPLTYESTSRYRTLSFNGAPGIEGVIVDSIDAPEVYVNGMPVSVEEKGSKYLSRFDTKSRGANISLRFKNNNGTVGGGALLRSPVFEICGRGEASVGDLSLIDGLRAYSGSVIYKSTVTLDDISSARYYFETDRVVSSLKVFVNGNEAATLFCAPWKTEITKFLKCGENVIELKVYNTLSNNLYTVPTKYRGKLEYGIMTPVRIIKTR